MPYRTSLRPRLRQATACGLPLVLALAAAGDDRAAPAVAALARDAAVAFHGRCLEARPTTVTVGGGALPATLYRFQVLEPLRAAPGEVHSFLQVGRPAGGPGDLGERAGLPVYETGAEYLLLLLPVSTANLTSPTGAAEGAFRVEAGQAVQLVAHGRRTAPHARAAEPLRLPLAELTRIVRDEGRP